METVNLYTHKEAADGCVNMLELLLIDLTNGYNTLPSNKERCKLVSEAIIWLNHYKQSD